MNAPSSRRLAGTFFLAILLSASAVAQISLLPLDFPATLPEGIVVRAGDFVDNVFVPSSGSSLSVSPIDLPPLNVGGFNIVIAPGAGLSGNSAALAAFNRAAQGWAARISDPITITIAADLASLGPGTIGQASSVTLVSSYNTVRTLLVADAALDIDDTIVASLPTSAQFTTTLPAGKTQSGNLAFTKANGKALGFTGLDQLYGATDATLTFSTNFSFDFDRSNGVTPGTMDFETVATHEIGHALGFISIVDSVGSFSAPPATTLDLFRFADNTAADPSSSAEFTIFARNLVPGTAAITDQITGATPEWGMSTVSDGRQASHWKDADLTGLLIGVMDPTLSFGQIFPITDADFRAFDLIGYDIAPVPEASTALFGLCATLAALSTRRRHSSLS